MSNQIDIQALPNDAPTLRRMVVSQYEQLKSYEDGKKAREAAAAQVAASAEVVDQIEIFEVKGQLEGLSDGSEDFTDPILRGNICRRAIRLIDALAK